MLDSFKVTLCNETTPRVHVSVEAEVSNGCLRISGQDLGIGVVQFWGDDEYEYFYSFSEVDTRRLFSLLHTGSLTPLEVLVTHFSGLDGCRCLRSFCDENNIKYYFFSC